MTLLLDVLARVPAQRLVELTGSDRKGGLLSTTIAGTLVLSNGSAAVVGTGTAFGTAFGANVVIQFVNQPGVSYAVLSIADTTHLTLAQAFTGPTTASTTAQIPGINYVTLQQAVFDAQAMFQDCTNLAYDDVTTSSGSGATLVLNRSTWAAISLVVAFLYENGRGMPWPEAEVEAAWKLAKNRLDVVLRNRGDGAYAPPASDSNLQPSQSPQAPPTFDNSRFTNLSSQPPGGGLGTSDYGGV